MNPIVNEYFSDFSHNTFRYLPRGSCLVYSILQLFENYPQAMSHHINFATTIGNLQMSNFVGFINMIKMNHVFVAKWNCYSVFKIESQHDIRIQ